MSAATDMERHMRIRNQATTKRLGRSRWAAIGAAVAVSMGAGGIGMIRAADNPERASLFVPIAPCRLADTRAASTVGPIDEPIGANSTLTFTGVGLVGECDLSPNATALSLNISSVGATAESFYTAWPAGENMPTASHLNPKPGQRVTGSGVDVSLSETGEFNLYNDAGTSDVVIDVLGVYVSGTLGAEGAAGAPGAPGQDGSDGAAGPQGEQGPAGAQGEIGPFGPVGPQGDAGTDGVDGEDGDNGQNGVDGQDGDTGPQGQNGTNGEDGSDGQNGTNGQDGTDGARGPQGEQGTQGEQGPAGQNGTNGENGTDGQDGQQGPRGGQGPQGPAGPEKTLWWIDADGDDYGSNDDFTLALTQPTGFVANNDDCRDDNAAVNPDAVEVPDNRIQGQYLDDDCDGVAFRTFQADLDNDSWTDPTNTIAADAAAPAPFGYAEFFSETDCNDADDTIHPWAQEIADDGIDQNCDGQDATIWYYDDDGDGYGLTDETRVNETPVSFWTASQGGDCLDDDIDTPDGSFSGSSINPGATEIEDNTVDENCDGNAPYTFFQDSDLDNYTTADTTVANWLTGTPAGYRNNQSNPLDCDDTDSGINPGPAAQDVADDGIDQNCDGFDLVTWYRDADNDGWTLNSPTTTSNTEPSGYSASNPLDCDDTDSAVNPDGSEDPRTPADDDCDGAAQDTGLWDLDGDGFFGAYPAETIQCSDGNDNDGDGLFDLDDPDCSAEGDWSEAPDCVDHWNAALAATYNPGAFDIPEDGEDQDCDGYDAAPPFVPNVFSPNEDGVDDTLVLNGDTDSFEEFSFTIYNRWGEIVFTANSLMVAWDGDHQTTGEPQNSGVFVYLMECQFVGQSSPSSKSGNITLIR